MVNPADNLRLCKSAVLPICQRFGSALNFNIHLHMLFLDGVYVASDVKAEPVFRRAPVPSSVQLQAVLERITGRIGRYLEREGLLVRDPEHDRAYPVLRGEWQRPQSANVRTPGQSGAAEWLNRRSQRRSFNWLRYTAWLRTWLPRPRIVHAL